MPRGCVCCGKRKRKQGNGARARGCAGRRFVYVTSDWWVCGMVAVFRAVISIWWQVLVVKKRRVARRRRIELWKMSEEEKKINKTKGGREVRGEQRRSTSFIAHFRP